MPRASVSGTTARGASPTSRRPSSPAPRCGGTRRWRCRSCPSYGPIYPPVDVTTFASEPARLGVRDQVILDSLPADFLLGVSRFVPYKRLEAVIDAGIAADAPVVLAGAGPEAERLRQHALRHRGSVT